MDLLTPLWKYLQIFYPLEIPFILGSVLIFIFGWIFWINLRRSEYPLSRSGAIIIGVLWTALCTIEFWILGPFSALGRSDEYIATVPWIYFLTHVHAGGLFAHAYSGGIDAMTGLAFGVQYISVERALFTVFPLWLAILSMKAGAVSFAYAGGYRLARSGLQLTRSKAAIIGLLAGIGNVYNIGWAVGGLGWAVALLPWGFYILCLRTGRARYYPTVLGLAILYSASTSILHSLPAFYVAVLIGSALLPPRNVMQFILGCGLFGVVSVLNWLDVLYGLFQLTPELARHNTVPYYGFSSILSGIAYVLRASADIMILPVGLIALGILAFRRERFVLWALPAFVLAVGLGPLLSLMNWRATGIPLLYAYRWDIVSDGYVLIGQIITARALRDFDWTTTWQFGHVRLPPLAALYFATVAVGAAADHKAINITIYQLYGGQAFFTRVAYLANCNWRPSEPFRIVTFSEFFAPNTANAYGLDTFDGSAGNFSTRRSLFFGLAVTKPAATPHHTHHQLRIPSGVSVLEPTVNLDALRIANVRYVLSDRRLTDSNLRLVSDVCSGSPFLGVSPQFASWLQSWAPHAAIQAPFIYEIPKAWPRIFIPTELRVSAAAIDNPSFYSELLKSSAKPIALISKADAELLAGRKPLPDAYALTDYRIVPNGFDIKVTARPKATHAPGIVVANVPYSRFWRATSRGRSLTVVPVDGIQMAVILDEIDGPIDLRYERPTIATRIAKALRMG